MPSEAGGFPGYGAEAAAINNLGQVAGFYWDANYFTNYYVHGFIYSPRGANNGYITLDYPPAAPCSILTSINDAGWVVGVWQDTSQNNQICGNTTNPQHCILWKPPYDTPESFDNFGGVANCSQFDGLGSGPYINGLGQYAGACAYGQMIDVTFGAGGPIFFDDSQANAPSLYDGINASVVIPASDSTSYAAVGLNNNGQIAGTAIYGQWVPYNQVGPIWESSGLGNNIFLDSEGSLYSFELDPAGCGSFVGVNDEVQLMEGGCVEEALPLQ